MDRIDILSDDDISVLFTNSDWIEAWHKAFRDAYKPAAIVLDSDSPDNMFSPLAVKAKQIGPFRLNILEITAQNISYGIDINSGVKRLLSNRADLHTLIDKLGRIDLINLRRMRTHFESAMRLFVFKDRLKNLWLYEP